MIHFYFVAVVKAADINCTDVTASSCILSHINVVTHLGPEPMLLKSRRSEKGKQRFLCSCVLKLVAEAVTFPGLSDAELALPAERWEMFGPRREQQVA